MKPSAAAKRALCLLVWVASTSWNCKGTPADSTYQCQVAPGQEMAPPTPVYLFFADGKTPIPNGRSCAGASVPPAFDCKFALGGDKSSCATQVQGYLDRWFADYNVYFTRTPPKESPYDTVVITNDNGWCQTSSRGQTLVSCSHRQADAAFALMCNDDPKDCAVLIAHEYGHLVGLAHTDSNTDIMYARACAQCDGFRNADISVPGGTCGRTVQNSNQLLCEALGARSLAPAPAEAVRCQDLAPPSLTVTMPKEGQVFTNKSVLVQVDSRDECGVKNVTVKAGLPDDVTFWVPPYQVCMNPPDGGGDLTIAVATTDNAGNQTSTSVHVSLVVDHPDGGITSCEYPDSGCHCAIDGQCGKRGRPSPCLSLVAMAAILGWCRRRRPKS